MKRMNGYILIETLIGLVIMSVVGLAVSSQITSSNNVKKTVEKHSEALEKNVLLLTRLRRDFLQIMNRSVRDENGDITPAFIGTKDSVTFTKAGWANPLEEERSTNQRVEMSFSGNELMRKHHDSLDKATSDGHVTRIYENITRFSIQYMNNKLNWQEEWNSQEEGSLPVAVKVTLSRNQENELTILVDTPSYTPTETTEE